MNFISKAFKVSLIKNYDSLNISPQRKIVLELIEAALSSIQPENVLKDFEIEDIEQYKNIYLIGFGKGSARISSIIEQKLGEKLTEGYVIDLERSHLVRGGTSKISYVEGTHPLPSQTNIDFTKKVVERFSNKLNEQDLVIVVVAGGGSALFELPIEGKTLEDIISLNNELLESGKNIREMNEERKKLSQVKGGKFAKLLSPAKVLGLIFSDVPGNDLSVVASGPTVDGLTENILMLSNKTALDAMKKKADELKVQSFIYFDAVQGEAKNIGGELLKVAKPNSILLAAGETTVTVHNKNGKGGRNQELVLGALSNLTIEQSNNLVIASFDSDGWDNSEFAGAIGDAHTVQSAKKINLDVQKYLDENNSFEFFQKTKDAIITGRLPANVSDLMIVYRN